MRLYINNGLIVDPVSSLESAGDLVIEDGMIKEIRLHPDKNPQADIDVFLDARGKWWFRGSSTCTCTCGSRALI